MGGTILLMVGMMMMLAQFLPPVPIGRGLHALGETLRAAYGARAGNETPPDMDALLHRLDER